MCVEKKDKVRFCCFERKELSNTQVMGKERERERDSMALNMQRRFNGNAFLGFLRFRKRGQGIEKKGQTQRVIKSTSYYFICSMTNYIF